MITNKLIELEPEISQQLTEEQMKNTFDSKPKWQRALIMFAGPLANFLLSIFIFTSIFISTIDPQTVPVVEKVYEDSNKVYYASSFEEGDKINSINGVTIKDAKDFNLELLSYAGYTGEKFANSVSKILGCTVEVVKRSKMHIFKVIPKR